MCLPTETVKVTENRSATMTSMEEQFGKENSDSFDVFVYIYSDQLC